MATVKQEKISVHKADDDDEEDPVVQEIPVFLSQKASEDIRLLQYPIRTANRSLEQDEHNLGQVRDVQYKIGANGKEDTVSLKYYLNTDSSNYINEGASNSLLHFSFSSKLVQQTSNYCVGIMRHDKLYINPIHSIYQMRPDFSHIAGAQQQMHTDQKRDDENNSVLETSSAINTDRNTVNCQVDHNKDNNDLYFHPQTEHQTRQFMRDKHEFLEQVLFNQASNYATNTDDIPGNKNNRTQVRTTQQHKYKSYKEIPAGIPQSEARKLSMDLSIPYYLIKCSIVTPAQLFVHLNISEQHKGGEAKALSHCLNYAYLLHGRLVVKHEYLRHHSLQSYKHEWNLLLQLFYEHQAVISKHHFYEIVGIDNIEYSIVDEMFALLATKCSSPSPQKRVVLWRLKHDEAEEDVNVFGKEVARRSREMIQKLMSQNKKYFAKMHSSKVSVVADDDGDSEMVPVRFKEEDEEEEDDDVHSSVQYQSVLNLVTQKLNKNKVLTREAITKLMTKYSTRFHTLQNVPQTVVELVLRDVCWRLDGDRFCLKEIESLDDKKEFNEHRKRIIDWFHKHRKESIKKTVIERQWKALIKPSEKVFQCIMASLCDWNESQSVWQLKSGQIAKKKQTKAKKRNV